MRYPQKRIATLLGREQAVVVIHGGIGREERLAVQEAFRHDPDVQVLLATDAAGEGIHLQRAHLMVNYDLPWNPNRLEQRFGRGQTEVCQLWNLVADDTREGDVYRRLLEKLERARQSLGGQVFDSLGKLEFEGATTLPKMLQHHRIEPWRTASARHSRHWAAEETHHPREVIEPALVHMVQTRSRRPTGFASRRTDPPWPILPADEDIFPAASRFRRMLVAGVQRIAPPGRRHAPAQRSGLRRLLPPRRPESAARHRRDSHRDPERYRDWLSHVREALPDVDNVTTIKRPEDGHRYLVVRYRNGLEAPSWLVSEGALRLLALTLSTIGSRPWCTASARSSGTRGGGVSYSEHGRRFTDHKNG